VTRRAGRGGVGWGPVGAAATLGPMLRRPPGPAIIAMTLLWQAAAQSTPPQATVRLPTSTQLPSGSSRRGEALKAEGETVPVTVDGPSGRYEVASARAARHRERFFGAPQREPQRFAGLPGVECPADLSSGGLTDDHLPACQRLCIVPLGAHCSHPVFSQR